MNKNIIMAELKVVFNKVYISRVISTIPPYINNIDEWVNNRLTPIGRENIAVLLKQSQITSQSEFLYVTHAISLNDTFWVNCVENPTTWDRINPFRNRFSKIISEIALTCNYDGGNLRSPSPDYTVDGSVNKCWKRKNGKIYLYKSDGECWSDKAGLRPYCEYYASQVAEQLGVHRYVRYGIEVGKTEKGYKKPYVFSEIFTSEKYGYVPIAYTKYGRVPLQQLYSLLSDRGKITLREMLLLDSITVNFDRHLGNYGFLFDTDSLKVAEFSPIFDNDCSLGALTSLQYKSISEAYNELTTRLPKTEMGDYIQQARIAIIPELRNNMINMYPFHFSRLPSHIDVKDNRIKFMEYIVNTQIKSILGATR